MHAPPSATGALELAPVAARSLDSSAAHLLPSRPPSFDEQAAPSIRHSDHPFPGLHPPSMPHTTPFQLQLNDSSICSSPLVRLAALRPNASLRGRFNGLAHGSPSMPDLPAAVSHTPPELMPCVGLPFAASPAGSMSGRKHLSLTSTARINTTTRSSCALAPIAAPRQGGSSPNTSAASYLRTSTSNARANLIRTRRQTSTHEPPAEAHPRGHPPPRHAEHHHNLPPSFHPDRSKTNSNSNSNELFEANKLTNRRETPRNLSDTLGSDPRLPGSPAQPFSFARPTQTGLNGAAAYLLSEALERPSEILRKDGAPPPTPSAAVGGQTPERGGVVGKRDRLVPRPNAQRGSGCAMGAGGTATTAVASGQRASEPTAPTTTEAGATGLTGSPTAAPTTTRLPPAAAPTPASEKFAATRGDGIPTARRPGGNTAGKATRGTTATTTTAATNNKTNNNNSNSATPTKAATAISGATPATAPSIDLTSSQSGLVSDPALPSSTTRASTVHEPPPTLPQRFSSLTGPLPLPLCPVPPPFHPPNPNATSFPNVGEGISSHSLAFASSGSGARTWEGVQAMLEMLAGRPEVVLRSPRDLGQIRVGDILSAKHVLVVDVQDALRGRRGLTGSFAGAPFFRLAPRLNVAGVAQPTACAARAVFQQLHRAHPEGVVVWINLRDEPLVYVHGVAYVVRERAHPRRPHAIPQVTGRGIARIEDKLKQEILREARENAGNVSVQVEAPAEGGLEDQWTSADGAAVQTPAEVFRELARERGARQLQYYRLPITQNVGPKPEDFDFVFAACLEEPGALLVFNCQTGRGRTSAMMLITSIVRFYQTCAKDMTVDVRVLRGAMRGPVFRTIQKLLSLFPDGKLHERRVNHLMELTDPFYSMVDHTQEAFANPEAEPQEAMMRLHQYALFLAFSCYCEQRLWNFATKSPFPEWLRENAEMELLIRGIRDRFDDQLREEPIELGTGVNSTATTAEDARVIRNRRGNVLSAGRILCCLPPNSLRQDGCSLRQLAPGVPLFTCGRLTAEDRVELVREIQRAFPALENAPRDGIDENARSDDPPPHQDRNVNNRLAKFHWLSLRAEPMVMINGCGYTLTEFSAPPTTAENGVTMHISRQAIERIEERLRGDVVLEAQQHGGRVLVHHVDAAGKLGSSWVQVSAVRTLHSSMEEFAQQCGVHYHRVPMPYVGQMLATDVDPLLRFLDQCEDDPQDVFFINDPEGSARAAVVLNMVVLHRASRMCNLRSLQSPDDFIRILRLGDSTATVCYATLPEGPNLTRTSGNNNNNNNSSVPDVTSGNVELLLASTICQMLTAGTLLNTVNAAISLGGRGVVHNLLDRLDEHKRRINVVGVNRPQALQQALQCLRCYLLVLLSSLYLDENGAYAGAALFSEWVSTHTAVAHIIDGLPSRGEAALAYVAAENLMRADVSRRSGEVLTANFCLKADHFPGCQKKGLRPTLCGAPNFRKVDFVNVYGVAMPTLVGMRNVLALLGATDDRMPTIVPNQSNDRELYRGFAAPRLFDRAFHTDPPARPLRGAVVWVNLREEPILYVGDRPFVFRDLAAPYVNVELTGIDMSKLVQVEAQLKLDVLREAQIYGGRFLVHDEAVPGELVGIWEPATESTVKTLWEVYAELTAAGARWQLLRLPVTDEQSPSIADFDELVTALLPHITAHIDRRETLSFVFNCQMGRGRTTTGMVICCLLVGLVMPEYYDELEAARGGEDATSDALYRTGPGTELWNGDYEVIVQLKRVLPRGRPAKRQVDLIIDACAQMQNLRTTIESFVQAERSPDHSEGARARAHHAGVHYLLRYFNLIAFAVYLEEAYDPARRRIGMSFQQWMRERPELESLSQTAALH